ncbi:MAG: hypothetical protein CUN54_05185 [Phototrophicales bacterium]|nr:MAG: hypothetical protein CUN54_05185 [Phototrophicales bacterium]
MKFVSKHFDLQDGLLLLIAAGVVSLYVAFGGGGFPLDDSWIHQVYGRNLAESGQWAFVPGEASAASTSPLYTILLAGGYFVGLPRVLWTNVLGILALASAGMLGRRIAERLLPEQKYVGMAAGLVLVLAWHLIWAAASGMETMIFNAMTLLLIWLGWRELDDSRFVSPQQLLWRGGLFGIATALTVLTRAEGIVLAGLIGGLMLAIRPQGTMWRVILWGGSAVVLFALIVAPYLLFNLNLTGGVLPDTAAAKIAENAPLLEESYPVRVVNMIFPLIAGGQLLLAPGLVIFVVMLRRQLSQNWQAWFYLLPLLWGVLLIAIYAARLPAPYQHGRYVIPSLPSFIVVSLVGVLWFAKQTRRSFAGRVVSRVLLIAAGIMFVYMGVVLGPQIYRRDVEIIDQEMVKTALWIEENIAKDALLAVHDIGAVGYFAPRPILDLAGLVSPEVVPIILDEEPLWRLMEQRNVRYLMAFPDQVPGDDVDDERLCLVYTTGGKASPAAGGGNMSVYRLTWNNQCP